MFFNASGGPKLKVKVTGFCLCDRVTVCPFVHRANDKKRVVIGRKRVWKIGAICVAEVMV